VIDKSKLLGAGSLAVILHADGKKCERNEKGNGGETEGRI